MTKKWKLLIALLLLGLGLYFFIDSFLYGEHKDYSKETIAYKFNQSFSYEKIVEKEAIYLEKAVSVKGKVSEIELNSLVLDGLFLMYFDRIPSHIKIGDQIEIKGRYIGNDELLEQIKIDQCTRINP